MVKARVKWPLLGIGLVGLAGLALAAAYWDPKFHAARVPNTAASMVSPDRLEAAARTRVFFGHRSVGTNVLDGLDEVYRTKGVAAPTVLELDVNAPPEDLPEGGLMLHGRIGDNGNPRQKLANFDTAMRAGVGDVVDVALLKFCYEDIKYTTDVDRLFADYRATLDTLERDYPQVRFLHATAPLTVGPDGVKDVIKVLVGRAHNTAPQRYNELLRAAWGPEGLFALAAVEVAGPNGEVAAGLSPGYSSDGSHLNESGSARAAVALIDLLSLPRQG